MFDILIGHLIGDYFLQNDWLALSKNKHTGLGWLTCTVHCILYTLAVCAITRTLEIPWVVLVFLSHFIIDKFGLPEKYLKAINGRSLERFMNNKDNAKYSPHIGLRCGFTTLVFVVVDNTMHLILMCYGWRYLYN